MKVITYRYLIVFAIVAAILVRFYFMFTVPLLGNDSVVKLAYAKVFADNTIIPREHTLATILIGLGFKLFGENILVGRFVELAAAVGSIYLIYRMGTRFFDRNTGIYSAFFLSLAPVHLFYSTISKVYSLLCFLSLLSLYLFLVGFKEKKTGYCLASAFVLYLSFLCKTFTLIGIVPFVVLFLVSLTKKNSPHEQSRINIKLVGSPLLLISGLVLLTFFWRLPEFGRFFYHDSPVDLSLQLMMQSVPSNWKSLLAFNSIAPFTLLPLLMAAVPRRPKDFHLTYVNASILSFIAVNVLVVTMNPLNHAPRGFIASMPLLCLLAGAALSKLMHVPPLTLQNLSRILAASVTATVFLFLFAFRFQAGSLLFLEMETLPDIVVSYLGIILISLLGQSLFSFFLKPSHLLFVQNKKNFLYLLISPLLAGHFLFGILLADQSLKRHATSFYPIFDAVSFAPSCNMIGGEDFVSLFDGTSFAFFSDLPPVDLAKVVSGDLEPVLNKYTINTIILRNKPAFGEEEILRGFTEKEGISPPRHKQALHSNRKIDRIFDNGSAALYQYTPIPSELCNKAEVLRDYTVPLQMPIKSTRLFFRQPARLDNNLSFTIENNHPTARRYTVKVAATVSRENGEPPSSEDSLPFYRRIISINRFSREDINIDLKAGSAGRVSVLVTGMQDERDYLIYREL
jgi:4-amino-4-deoxy-L-arabinose transferase-like glycosyltransferase